MTQIDYGRAAGYFLLKDFFVGFKLGLKYFFAPKATLNYPHEKGPRSERNFSLHYVFVCKSGAQVELPRRLAMSQVSLVDHLTHD